MGPQGKYEEMLYGKEQGAGVGEPSSLSQDQRSASVLENAIIDEIVNMVVSPGYKPDIKTLETIRDSIKWPRGWGAFAGNFVSKFGDEILPRIVKKVGRSVSAPDMEDRIGDAWSVISKELFAMGTERQTQKAKEEKATREREEMSGRERTIAKAVGIIVNDIFDRYRNEGDIKFVSYIQQVDAETGFASSMPGSTEGDSRGRLKAILNDIRDRVFKKVRKEAPGRNAKRMDLGLGLGKVDYEKALEEFSLALDRFLDSLSRNKAVGSF